MIKLINLTPHPVVIRGMVFQPEGLPFRLKEERIHVGILSFGNTEIPINRVFYSIDGDLPPKKEGVVYIVSAIAARAIAENHPERNDFLVVDETIRNNEGQIIGCLSLATLSNQAPSFSVPDFSVKEKEIYENIMCDDCSVITKKNFFIYSFDDYDYEIILEKKDDEFAISEFVKKISKTLDKEVLESFFNNSLKILHSEKYEFLSEEEFLNNIVYPILEKWGIQYEKKLPEIKLSGNFFNIKTKLEEKHKNTYFSKKLSFPSETFSGIFSENFSDKDLERMTNLNLTRKELEIFFENFDFINRDRDIFEKILLFFMKKHEEEFVKSNEKNFIRFLINKENSNLVFELFSDLNIKKDV